MPMGSTRSCSPGGGVVVSVTSYLSQWTSNRRQSSDVEEAHVLGVALDELPAGFDVLTHEDAEKLVRRCSVVQGHLEQHPAGRVHGGGPQLGGVHLAETLEPLDAVVLARVGPAGLHAELDQPVPLLVGVGVLD